MKKVNGSIKKSKRKLKNFMRQMKTDTIFQNLWDVAKVV